MLVPLFVHVTVIPPDVMTSVCVVAPVGAVVMTARPLAGTSSAMVIPQARSVLDVMVLPFIRTFAQRRAVP